MLWLIDLAARTVCRVGIGLYGWMQTPEPRDILIDATGSHATGATEEVVTLSGNVTAPNGEAGPSAPVVAIRVIRPRSWDVISSGASSGSLTRVWQYEYWMSYGLAAGPDWYVVAREVEASILVDGRARVVKIGDTTSALDKMPKRLVVEFLPAGGFVAREERSATAPGREAR